MIATNALLMFESLVVVPIDNVVQFKLYALSSLRSVTMTTNILKSMHIILYIVNTITNFQEKEQLHILNPSLL